MQSKDMELQGLIAIISSKQPVDYQKRFERSVRARDGKLTEEEVEQVKKDEQILQDKIMAAEKTKVYVNFFNKPAMRLIAKSNNNKVYNIYCSSKWHS